MATLHIEHPISDLQTWLDAYEYIYVALDFDSKEDATAFKHFLETKVWASPEASPALRGTPRARVLTEVGT